MDFHKATKVLKRWRWTFISVALVTICLVAFAPENTVKPTPFYKSSAKILLTPSGTTGIAYRGAAAVNSGGDISRAWFADPTILNELIKSEELLTRVQTNSGTDLSWESLRAMIQIEPLEQSGRFAFGQVKLFKLSVTAGDPQQSEKLTRLVTDEFKAYVQDLSAREFATTRRFIEELVLEAEQRRLTAEEELLELKAKYADSPSDEALASEERSLDSERQSVNREIATLKAQVASVRDYLDGRVSNPPWAILENQEGSLASLEANVAKNKLDVTRAREIYTDSNEKVVLLLSRLKRSEELYNEALSDYVSSLYQSKSSELQQRVRQRSALTLQLSNIAQSKMTADDRRQTKKLERQMTLWDENHLNLTQQLYQAQIVEQSSRRQGSVNVLEQPRRGTIVATAGSNRVATSKNKKLAIAIPFCLIIAAAAAFLREFLSTSMKLRPRIEEALELPIIAVIPATPSELTVDWERYKRPMTEGLGGLVMAHSAPPASRERTKEHVNGNGNSHRNGL